MNTEQAHLVSILQQYNEQDIGVAKALPMPMYTSEALFELERKGIFGQEWLCVGRTEQVSEIGDYFTVEVLGEPNVVVRGKDDRLRAMSAVCRHRYYSVVEGAGNTTRFVCGYHKWVYALDGELRGAPHMGDISDMQGQCKRLPQLSLEIWLGFIFINFDASAEPLHPGLSGAEPHWANYGVEDWKVTPWVNEVWPGNWKLAMETALEGYHVNGLHPDTFAKFMPSSTSNFEDTANQWTMFRLGTVFKDEFSIYQQFADTMPDKDKTSAPQFGFFPNCAVSCTQFGGIWLTFLPIDVGHTRVIGGNLVNPAMYEMVTRSPETQAGNAQAINAINREDAQAMVNLQRNAHSMFAEPGLLGIKEKCLLYFYRYLATKLDRPPTQFAVAQLE